MGLFDHITGAAKAAQNAVFGDPVRVVPTRANADVNTKGRIADPVRPAINTTGRFYRPVDVPAAGDPRDVISGGMASRSMQARNPLSVTIDGLPFKPANDDFVEDLKTGQWFRVVHVEADGTGSHVLHLTAEGAGPVPVQADAV